MAPLHGSRQIVQTQSVPAEKSRKLHLSSLANYVPGLAIVCILAGLAWLTAEVTGVVSPLVAGVVLGVLTVNAGYVRDSWSAGISFCARTLLRLGIVLLGLQLAVSDLVQLGPGGLAVVFAVVGTTFLGTRAIGRRLGIPSDLCLLIATGYSICGASAIAAVEGVVGAKEEETAYAISLVTLCGTLSIVVLPFIAHGLGLSDHQYGTWIGGAVHDVGQVVATASVAGGSALSVAMVVKLARVVLLAPLVAVLSIRRSATHANATARPPLLPLFVVGFLLAIGIRSIGVVPGGVLDSSATLEKLLLTAALVALGMGVRFSRLRVLGGRPLVLGLVAWALVALTALIGTTLVGAP